MKIDQIREKLGGHRAASVDVAEASRASVALILRSEGDGPEVMLIERAQRDGDPWSGHIALPGGRAEAVDATSLDVAIRETREEVGVDLISAEYLGHLEDFNGSRRVTPPLIVSAHAFYLAVDQPLVLDPLEVSSVLWFPLAGFHQPNLWVDHEVSKHPGKVFPGVAIGESGRHVLWGLTYRFMGRFFELIEQPMADRPGELEVIQNP